VNSIYNIAGIKLYFSYFFEDYFKDNIEKYLCFGCTYDYQMTVTLLDEITAPLEDATIVYKNRELYEHLGERKIVSYNVEDGRVSHQVNYDKDYRKIDILLSKQSTKNLAELEYILTGVLFAEIALKEGLIALHASAIVLNEKVYLFSAPSGGEKTTIEGLILRVLDETYVINDDKPLIRKEDDHFEVYGSPWSGKNQVNLNEHFPLNTIFFLEKAKKDEIISLSTKEQIELIYRNTHRSRDENEINTHLKMIEDLVSNISMKRFYFQKNESAVKTFERYIGGQNET